ncbi:MAG: hypothetical protein ACW98F_14670 [Candidatus Hodarchaeales archaeon]
MKCPLCGTEYQNPPEYCDNCSTYLSSDSGLASSPPLTNYGSRPDDTQLGRLFISWIIDALYIFVSIFIIIRFASTVNTNNLLPLSSSEEDIPLLVYISLLLILSLVRAGLNLRLNPPDPFPEGYRLPNLMLGIIVLPLFFVIFPYFFLGIGITFLLNLIFLIWGFFSPSRERKKALFPSVERTNRFLKALQHFPEERRNLLMESLQDQQERQKMEKMGFDIELLEQELTKKKEAIQERD